MATWTSSPGLVLVDKPCGWTSRRAGAVVSKQLGIKKIGHLGTLDPFATGLLPLCVGRGTRLSHFLDQSRKVYEAELVLGVETDSADREGEVLSERPVPPLTSSQVQAATQRFMGAIEQVPPVYSAVKIDGERAYRRARRGEQVEIPARRVDIYRFEVELCAPNLLRLLVECGPGTYIRSLGRDLARALGSVGHLRALRRTQVGGLSVVEACHPEQLSKEAVWSVGTLLGVLGDPVHVADSVALHIRQGKPLEVIAASLGEALGRRAVFAGDRPVALVEKSEAGWRILRGLPAD